MPSPLARLVLRALFTAVEATRPELSTATGVTRPSVRTALLELEALGLVVPLRVVGGTVGRAATIFGVAPDAGWVLGIDVGAGHVAVVARDLAGSVLAADRHARDHGRRDAPATVLTAIGTARDLVARLHAHGPLRAVVAAVPSFATGTARRPGVPVDPDRFDVEGLTAGMTPLIAADGAWAIENDVNCAAVAEGETGSAAGVDTYAYLHVGRHIGAALVLAGALVRGVNGAAGEIAFAPHPWSPDTDPEPLGLERRLGAAGLLAHGGPLGLDDLLAASAVDDDARMAVRRIGSSLGDLAALVAAVVDPGLVVLGGSVGRRDAFLAAAAERLDELNGYTTLATAAVGGRAGAEGAATLALRTARRALSESPSTGPAEGAAGSASPELTARAER
ncbi:ROK family protein [Curtobacterium sp. VKM Ac-1376]|uniref:ROK family protein n=1 Tax=Curtobacterium sp. VKM Ac-1376 TaxID=123312 RepID=UPI00188D3586|nr:ROK family protein [Curtobacterium sp. VKM Ac-1376]MBF4616007.1 ROK family protein [Curtobacterium sp. VKM Ac-1376]